MSAQKIEAELTALIESFAILVRSARINEDTDDARRAQVCVLLRDLERRLIRNADDVADVCLRIFQVPGEIVEILAEKVVYAAHELLQSTAELKRRAFLASGGARLTDGSEVPGTADAALKDAQNLKAETEETLQVCQISCQCKICKESRYLLCMLLTEAGLCTVCHLCSQKPDIGEERWVEDLLHFLHYGRLSKHEVCCRSLGE